MYVERSFRFLCTGYMIEPVALRSKTPKKEALFESLIVLDFPRNHNNLEFLYIFHFEAIQLIPIPQDSGGKIK